MDSIRPLVGILEDVLSSKDELCLTPWRDVQFNNRALVSFFLEWRNLAMVSFFLEWRNRALVSFFLEWRNRVMISLKFKYQFNSSLIIAEM